MWFQERQHLEKILERILELRPIRRSKVFLLLVPNRLSTVLGCHSQEPLSEQMLRLVRLLWQSRKYHSRCSAIVLVCRCSWDIVLEF